MLGHGALGLWDGRIVLGAIPPSQHTSFIPLLLSQSLALQFLYLCLDVLEFWFVCFTFLFIYLVAWGPSCSTRDLLIAARVL